MAERLKTEPGSINVFPGSYKVLCPACRGTWIDELKDLSHDVKCPHCQDTHRPIEYINTVERYIHPEVEAILSHKDKSERVSILEEGIKLTTQDRKAVYGDFVDNMDLAASLMRTFNIGLARSGVEYSQAHNEAIRHVLAKIARIANGTFHRDNYVDGAVYLAAAAECEMKHFHDENFLVNSPHRNY